jgi:hypothetical protein
LEHVAGQNAGGITSEISNFGQFLAFFRGMIWTNKNLITPSDKAHRVVFRKVLERFEDVPWRIASENN